MKRLGIISILLFFLVGCSTIAPNYNTDFTRISKMRSEKLNPIKVGAVTKDPNSKEDVDLITIRGGRYESPNGTFTAYLQEALKQELEDAQLLNQSSSIELTGVLLKNDVDASGVSIGIAEIIATFIVTKNGVIRFNKNISAKHSWDSSFAGNIAIPRAHQNYPVAVQKLVGNLFADQEFIAVLKP